MAIIDDAVSVLRAGGLLGFPTETVYGLGADATNPQAVAKIFAAKGRAATNPLIVHVADRGSAPRYAAAWPAAAEKLAERFWPGALSIVVPKSEVIAPAVTAGRMTVGLRAPDHPLALELLRSFGGAVAAPSANKSNRVSPTTAQHVRDELGDAVDLILDGGRCRVGIESTVLDLSGATPTILRPGGVSREQIEVVIGPVAVFSGVVTHGEAAASPGQSALHYAPRTPTFRFETAQRGQIDIDLGGAECGLVVLSPMDVVERYGRIVALSCSPEVYARHLYGVLRELDAMDLAAIFIELPPDEPQWAAVRDRIIRASEKY
jgi:L-threonylcarbamoyladenylate synthase